jgi:hypothetical protein
MFFRIRAQFPFWSGRRCSPAVAAAADLLAPRKALHLGRVVIVTPGVYGTDNRTTLDGMHQLSPWRARAVTTTKTNSVHTTVAAGQSGGLRWLRGELRSVF